MIILVLYKHSFFLKIPFIPGFISALQGVIYSMYHWQNPVVVVHLGKGFDNKSPLQAMVKLDFYKGMGAMPTLQIQLLGDFLLAYDGRLVMTVIQARMQTLLAYLLLHCFERK